MNTIIEVTDFSYRYNEAHEEALKKSTSMFNKEILSQSLVEMVQESQLCAMP